MTVQWYPGHMAKARRLVSENLSLVDLVVEIRDARIAESSANPDLLSMIGKKPRIIIFNKSDLADKSATDAWIKHFRRLGIVSMAFDSRKPRLVKKVVDVLRSEGSKYVRKSRLTNKPLRPARCMIVGIPNVGKSSFINALARRSAARTGAKPGLTRAKQMINIADGLQFLDTPGILWPKFEDPLVGLKLAATGAVSEAGFAVSDVAEYVFNFLRESDAVNTTGIDANEFLVFLERFASKRGYLRRGGELHVERAMQVLWQEFSTGKLGRYTLELP